MADAMVLESPWTRLGAPARDARSPTDAGVVVTERAFLGHLNLRGDPRDARFMAGVRGALGVDLPAVANTLIEAQGSVIYWLGPDEWLVVTPRDGAPEAGAALRQALSGVRAAVTDVSGGQTVVVLRGRAVRDLLSKGCPLDLDPRVFRIGACAQSHLAKASILIRPLEPGPAFEIVVRRSFADYFRAWLEDAGAEYGLQVTA